MRYHEYLYKNEWLMVYSQLPSQRSWILRMFKKVFWQGRSERRGEAYYFCMSSLGAMRERS